MPFSNWDYPYQTYADGCLRLVIGFLALVVLRFIYKAEFKRLFCNKIHSKTWIYLIPFWASLVIYIVMFICAEEVSFALLPNFFVNWIIQITTGFWEEAVCRGIFMVGMLCFWKTSVRGRLFTIGTAGLFFGLIHFSSFFFGLFESVSSEILSLSSFSTISLSRLFRISSIFHDFATIFIFVISLGSKKNSSTRLSIISRKARNQTS